MARQKLLTPIKVCEILAKNTDQLQRIYIATSAINSAKANDISFPRAVGCLKRASPWVTEIHEAIRASKLLPSDRRERRITGDKPEKSGNSGNWEYVRFLSLANEIPSAFVELASLAMK